MKVDFNKSLNSKELFSFASLASVTALAACGGGGGGGGGGLPDVGDNNYFDGFSGQVSALQARDPRRKR